MPQRLLTMIRMVLFMACLGWQVPVSAWPFLKDPSGVHAPEVGKLLVAMPDLNHPHFKAAVILLLHYSQQGAAGLILNRPTRLTLAAEFEDQVSERLGKETLYWGGPQAMDRRVMLLESFDDETARPLEQVLDSIYLANELSEFRRLLKQESPVHRLRVFAGYTGWGPSQLEQEIIRGDWLVLPGRAELVMPRETESIWPQLMHYRHGLMAAFDLGLQGPSSRPLEEHSDRTRVPRRVN